MSSWNDSAKWRRYLSREGCPVCNQTPETRPATERSIADLSVSRLITDSNTCLKGYCCLVLKPHVIEIYDLSDEDSAAFRRDVKVASLALKRVTATVKINYDPSYAHAPLPAAAGRPVRERSRGLANENSHDVFGR